MLKHCSLRRMVVAAAGSLVIGGGLFAQCASAQIIVGQTAGFTGAVAATVKEATDGAKLYIDLVNAKVASTVRRSSTSCSTTSSIQARRCQRPHTDHRKAVGVPRPVAHRITSRSSRCWTN